MNTKTRYRGRFSQLWICLGKLFRMFLYQNDWKVLPMSAIIAGLVTFVVGPTIFVTQEGTITGCFALACTCIWNGFFNSIQVVCRERNIVKREHRAGLHMSSYMGAHMIYQLVLCVAQVVITLLICKAAHVNFPDQGIITGSGILDIGITMLLITYASDMLAILVSCLVKTTTTAMTVMPFILIFQLVFSGSYFTLEGFAEKLTKLTVSNWGLNALCAIGRYNEQPMVTLWNTVIKFKDIEVAGFKPILQAFQFVQENNLVQDIIQWSGSFNTNPAFNSDAPSVLAAWNAMGIMCLVGVVGSILALELIARAKR